MKCHIKVEKPPMEDIAAIQSLLLFGATSLVIIEGLQKHLNLQQTWKILLCASFLNANSEEEKTSVIQKSLVLKESFWMSKYK